MQMVSWLMILLAGGIMGIILGVIFGMTVADKWWRSAWQRREAQMRYQKRMNEKNDVNNEKGDSNDEQYIDTMPRGPMWW